MSKKDHSGLWKKGKSGNPAGRPPDRVLPKELIIEANENRAAIKKLFMTYFNLSIENIQERQRTPGIPSIELMLGNCFKRAINDGDVVKMKMLLEMAVGNLEDERKPTELNQEELLLVETYRKRMNERPALPASDGDSESENKPDESESSGEVSRPEVSSSE